MKPKERIRYLQKVVGFCVGFTASMIVACFIAICFKVDMPEYILKYTCMVFGGELLLSAAIKIFEKPKEEEKKNGST